MLYVGIDAHWNACSYCILDANGAVVKEEQVRGPWHRLVSQLRRRREPLTLAYDASCGYGALYDQLAALPHVRRICVAHPGKLRLIFRSQRKNDRTDARQLALLLLNQLPTVHVPHQDVRSWREAITYRQKLVQQRTGVKNQLRALLRGHGIPMPRSLWSQAGLTWLAEAALPGPLPRLKRMGLLDQLRQVQAQLKQVERELNRIGRAHPGVRLLQTIPGVGPRTAEAVMAYIDQPKRFGRNKTIGPYFGIVPRQDASGPVNHLGHITRQGPAVVRRLITEATWQAVRRDATVARYFQRVQQGRPQRKKLALVATAHYLLRVMLAMLQNGEAWRGAA